MTAILLALATAVWTALILRIGWVAARIYQLEEYDGRRLIRWMRETPSWTLHRTEVWAFLSGAVISRAGVLLHRSEWVAGGWLVAGVVGHLLWRWTPPKKALTWTPRAKRLLATASLLGLILSAASAVDTAFDPLGIGVVVAVAGTSTLPLALLIAANVVLWPYELVTRRGFRRQAERKLEQLQPTVVTVAGSYGKTTTKRIIAQVLDRDGDTWPTPRSFNTLMGITRTINDDLLPSHRTFVVEMDPYGPGEIAAMCRLTHPTIAVITAVGPQHLERFGQMSRIQDALFEVVEGLPADGAVVIHGGDPQTAGLANRAVATGRRTVRYGIADGAVNLDVVASEVRVRADGSSFRWEWVDEKLTCDVSVPLLGRHQVLNASAALTVAHLLGRSLDDTVAALTTLQPVEHRLQPVPTANGIMVIDDSYNANVVGVHNALEVLELMDVRSRILVTPGIVELGEVEEGENVRYGEHAGRVCQEVIVVEARTRRALVRGLQESGLAPEHIHVAQSLEEATTLIGQLARPGDVVLFANDLPDTY